VHTASLVNTRNPKRKLPQINYRDGQKSTQIRRSHMTGAAWSNSKDVGWSKTESCSAVTATEVIITNVTN